MDKAILEGKEMAVDRLQSILNELQDLGDEAKQLINRHFPEYRSRVEAYKMLDFIDECSGFGGVVYDAYTDVDNIYLDIEEAEKETA